ncbi:hypothetical protein PDQ31_17990 [Bacillus cereus]|uniref:hypothetical protein n=1 Tax=Bacillus cereus group sp. MYBK34-1 TaxID=3450631 RepID=UPI003F78B67C|nr:hypothetical protein [Bacillus cereus]
MKRFVDIGNKTYKFAKNDMRKRLYLTAVLLKMSTFVFSTYDELQQLFLCITFGIFVMKKVLFYFYNRNFLGN